MKKVDPVCKLTLDPAEASKHLYLDGKLYYFCSDTCKYRFIRTPFQFLPVEPNLVQKTVDKVLPVNAN